MTGRAGGKDPTRTGPGGSRTETKIAEESAFGHDGGGNDPRDRRDVQAPDRPERPIGYDRGA